MLYDYIRWLVSAKHYIFDPYMALTVPIEQEHRENESKSI